jgi:hypothetical protein
VAGVLVVVFCWWCFGGGLEEGFFLIWAFCEIEREEEVWSLAIGMK